MQELAGDRACHMVETLIGERENSTLRSSEWRINRINPTLTLRSGVLKSPGLAYLGTIYPNFAQMKTHPLIADSSNQSRLFIKLDFSE